MKKINLDELDSIGIAAVIGWNLSKREDKDLYWLYKENSGLEGSSPKDFLDSGVSTKKVAEVFEKDFETTLEMPDFMKK